MDPLLAAAVAESGTALARNSLGYVYQVGKETPIEVRMKVVEVVTASLAEKAAGGAGKTWAEIAAAIGGPTSRTCQNIWSRWVSEGVLTAREHVSNPKVKLDEVHVLFLVDVYRRHAAFQLAEYQRVLLQHTGLAVSEACICRLFQALDITIKDPGPGRSCGAGCVGK